MTEQSLTKLTVITYGVILLIAACGDTADPDPEPELPPECPVNAYLADHGCVCEVGHDWCADGCCPVVRDPPPEAWGLYRIYIRSVTGIPDTDTAGVPWDTASYPDPYVAIYLDGEGYRTSTAEDTLSAEWDMWIDWEIQASTRYAVEVWDEDIGQDDPIIGMWDEAWGFEEGDLRAGELVLGGETGIEIRIELRAN